MTNLIYCYTLYALSVFSLAKLILEISATYELVCFLVAVNLLTCRLRAQCMTWKSTFKLCSARQCVFVDIFFKRMIKQLLDSFFADNTYLKLDSIQTYLKNVIQWLFDFAYQWFVWLKHGNTRTEGSSKLSGGLKRRKLNKSSSSAGFLFWECLSPILNVTWQWLLLYVTTFWRFPFVIG